MSAETDSPDALVARDGDAAALVRDPAAPAVLDFERLRLEAIDVIRRLGSDDWSDYNTHDPGITILEALIWSVNDLGYRTLLPIDDLLARPAGEKPPAPGDGPLFSALTILPSAPVTVLDLRKTLVDVPGVKNAWLLPSAEGSTPFFADREGDRLSYRPPAAEPDPKAVVARGVYDVALEFDVDPDLGDVGDHSFEWKPDLGAAAETFDLVLPAWDAWRGPRAAGAGRLALGDPWLTGKPSGAEATNRGIDDAGVLHADVVLAATTDGVARDKTVLDVRVFHRTRPERVKKHEAALVAALADLSSRGNPLRTYHGRLGRAFELAAAAAKRLAANRPLCEDFHEPTAAPFAEIGVCADVDILPGADLEAVAAQAHAFLMDLWSRAVRFRTLGELRRAGTPVETIFEGPALDRGFLLDEDLLASEPPSAVHASDVLHGIMDLDGVIAVRNLSLTSYDDDGTPAVEGAPWEIPLGGRLPRFAPDKSRLAFYKDGVPFHPRGAELADKIALIAGSAARGSKSSVEHDLPPPLGRRRDLETYRPVRDDLPHAYGVRHVRASRENEQPPPLPVGKLTWPDLPAAASVERRAQAAQLTAFLLVFDQILANGLAQLAHLETLLSLSPGPLPTYFASKLPDDAAADALFDRGVETRVEEATGKDLLADTPEANRERRDRMLDHMLARFGEQFGDYAAVTADMADEEDRRTAADKARFLADYPALSRRRGLGADVDDADRTRDPENVSGLEKRLERLLGVDRGGRRRLSDNLQAFEADDGADDVWRWGLRDPDGGTLLRSVARFRSRDEAESAAAAAAARAKLPRAYDVVRAGKRLSVVLTDDAGAGVAESPEFFTKPKKADAALERVRALVADASLQEGFHLVEHLLLRPEVPVPDDRDEAGLDELMQPGLGGDCAGCSADADPYSFRATLVVAQWPPRFQDAAFRDFVERTARAEAPAHVFLKICWIGEDKMREFETSYFAWRRARAARRGEPASSVAAKRVLVGKLQELRSTYPPATLHDCLEDAGDNPVRLGSRRLGKAKGP